MLSPELRRELDELLGYVLDLKMTPQQRDRLRQIISEHPEAERLYFAFTQVHAQLLWKHGAVTNPELDLHAGQPIPASDATVKPRLAAGETTARYSTGRRRPILGIPAGTWTTRPLHMLLIALACLGMAFGGWWLWLRSDPEQPAVVQQPAANEPAAVAQLTRSVGAEWANGGGAADGDRLAAGRQLVIDEGLAEIAFNSQASIILEGPANLTIVDANKCSLSIGKLTARVPEPAQGFTVLTPDATIVDRGTEFGVVVVQESGVRDQESTESGGATPSNPQSEILNLQSKIASTEVHVFAGRVDVAAAAAEPHSAILQPSSAVLTAGQGVRIEGAGQELAPIDARPEAFARDLPGTEARTLLVHDDFEAYEPGQQLDQVGPWRTYYETGARGAAQTIHAAEPSAPAPAEIGRRVLLLRDTLSGRQPNPVAGFGLSDISHTERIDVQFDFRLLTPQTRPLVSLGMNLLIEFGPELAIRGGRSPLGTITAQRWYRLFLSISMRGDRAQQCSVRLLDLENGRETAAATAPLQPPVKLSSLGWVWGFVPSGEQGAGGSYELDNVEVRAVRVTTPPP